MNRITLLGCIIAPAVLTATASAAETVEQNYRLYCVQCHGSTGTGQGVNQTAGGLAVSPRDHTSAAEMSKLTDAEIQLAIAKGGDAVQKSELMPPWDGVLDATQIDEMVAYLRKLCNCAAAK
jgi:mono/diheme cytochrome c family protein